MRNKLFLFIIIFILPFIYGCGGKTDLNQICSKSISEVRENFYLANIDDLVLTFSSGYREKDYNLDANYSGESVEFGLITLYSKSDSFLDDKNASFYFTYNDESYSGLFEKNPYDGSLVCDIEKYINPDKFDIKIEVNGKEYNFNLNNLSKEWRVKYSDVINIACVKNASIIKNSIKNNKLYGEVYIKLSYNFKVNLDAQWYVKFLLKEKTISVIIDKNTGNIISNVIQ